MRRSTAIICAAGLVAAASPLAAAPGRWIATWGSAQMVPGANDALEPVFAAGVTVRQRVHLSIGGARLRVRFSNAFGREPLPIDAAALALAPAPGTARAGAPVPLRFGGAAGVTIPAGAEIYSDPVAMAVADGADLAVSLHLPALPTIQTGHPGARTASFTVPGNQVTAPDLPGAGRAEHWYALADVEVEAPEDAATLVAIGDSITDGHGVVSESDGRWTDRLAARLHAAGGRRWGVVNAGIGGNRVLLDGLGPNLVARFDRDVIARSGVRTAIVLEGINDIGTLTREHPATAEAHAALVSAMEEGFRQMVQRAHAHGIAVIGGTVMPFGGNDYYHPGPESEADRQAVNAFIRTSGTFDAVIDFDRAMRDPAHPDRLLPAYDSGDHLHPGPAGYRAMGDAVPLAILAARPRGATPVIGAAAAVPVAPPAPATGPVIALTFDDLPAHGPLPPGTTRLQVADALIAALAAERAPAFGFVNGGFGADDPQSPAVLKAWRAAGLPLGNHGFGHLNLAQVGVAAFEADVVRDEGAIAPLMKRADWHWFRYPFLSEGASPADRDAVRGFLAQRGYKVAAVTMSFGDYGWNEPYARCVAKGDTAAVASLKASYLAAARAEAERERALSRAALGRDVPYVLLMHAGAFDARMLPDLLAQYRAMGFRFVPLAQAEADPFYAAATDPSAPGPSPTLAAAAARAQVPVPPGPALPADTICR